MLTQTERKYLLDKIQVSCDYERVIKHRIKKKLKDFLHLELPLIQARVPDVVSTVTACSNVTDSCNAEKGIRREGPSILTVSYLGGWGRWDLNPRSLPPQGRILDQARRRPHSKSIRFM